MQGIIIEGYSNPSFQYHMQVDNNHWLYFSQIEIVILQDML